MKKTRQPEMISGELPLSFEHYLLVQGIKGATTQEYSYYVYDFIGWLDRQNIKPEKARAKEMAAFLERLKKQGVGESTRAIRLNALRHYFNYQIASGKRKSNPVDSLKIPGRTKGV